MTRKMLSFTVLLSVLGLFVLALPVFGQTEIVNPNANISWPPPVYAVSGEFTVRGSANLPNQSNYFLEYRQLPEFTPGMDPNAPETWIPATAPSATAVQDGILGIWDTSLTDDGVYALRLTIRIRNGQPVTSIVSPIRVLNFPPPFAAGEMPNVVVTSVAPAVPTLPPVLDTTPRVTVTRSSINVRQGDSTGYPIITSLSQGDSVPVLGISSLGTGWYFVQLPDGRRGWVAPSVVTAEGDFANITRLAPPPLPATQTPTPIPVTATPTSAVNLVAGIVQFDTASPTCATPFTVGFDVANLGTVPSPGGFVSLTDSRQADGVQQITLNQPLPIINPGQTVRINFPLTVSTWYNEVHVITLIIDSQNQVAEFNENDNRQTVTYVLAKGGCP